MDNAIGVVCLHGAGLGAFIWDDVLPRLRGEALAPEFPGRGQGEEGTRGLTLEDYADAITDRVAAWGPGRVVLVAHSIAGCVALRVADRLGDRVAGLVGVGAAFPRSGRSFVSCLELPQRLVLPVVLRVLGTRPPARAIEQGLCTDLPPDRCREVVDRFTPESRRLYTDSVEYRSLPAERWYVRLAGDRDFPPASQDASIRSLAATTVVELDGGHLPMLTRPADVARILEDVMERVRRD